MTLRRPIALAVSACALALAAWMLLRSATGGATPTFGADPGTAEPLPPDLEPATALARAIELHDARRHREARPLLEGVLRSNPENHEARHYLGLTLVELHELGAAEQHLEAALDAEPENADYAFGLARALGLRLADEANPLAMVGLATRSKSLLDRAIELDGGLLDARLGRILFYLMAPELLGGGMDKARAEAAAIEREDEAVGLFARGWLAEEDGEWTEAEAFHRRSIALDPDYPRVRHRLGYLLLGQHRADEAREQFEAYRRIEPNNPFAHEGLARCLAARGDLEAATRAAERSVELDPRFHQGVYRLAECHAEAGRTEPAREQFERFLELAGDRESESHRIARAEAWLDARARPEGAGGD